MRTVPAYKRSLVLAPAEALAELAALSQQMGLYEVHEPDCAPTAAACHPQNCDGYASSVGTPTHSAKVTA